MAKFDELKRAFEEQAASFQQRVSTGPENVEEESKQVEALTSLTPDLIDRMNALSD